MARVKPYIRAVYYYETDQMGVVHHSNYIRWFEEARLDYLHQMGLDYGVLEQEGLMIPVLSVACRYSRPVRFPGTVQISAKPTTISGLRCAWEYEVTVSGEGKPTATGESTHCFVNGNMVPLRLDKRKPALFAKMQTWLSENQEEKLQKTLDNGRSGMIY